jgi:predicted nucleic acid-binding protein
MDAFDSDVLIYAAAEHPFRDAIRRLLMGDQRGAGSVILVPEVLSKLIRTNSRAEVEELSLLLGLLDLIPCDEATAYLAATVGAAHGLKAADAIHLATAVYVGADRFITNNRRDFPQTIAEIDIVYPDQL